MAYRRTTDSGPLRTYKCADGIYDAAAAAAAARGHVLSDVIRDALIQYAAEPDAHSPQIALLPPAATPAPPERGPDPRKRKAGQWERRAKAIAKASPDAAPGYRDLLIQAGRDRDWAETTDNGTARVATLRAWRDAVQLLQPPPETTAAADPWDLIADDLRSAPMGNTAHT